MKIEPVSDAVGAKITGLDLSRELDADAIAEIKSAWLKYQVLVFPDQEMTEQEQIRFTKYWGEMPLRAHHAGRREEARRAHESIMLISNIREDGEPIGSLPDGDMMFHSDGQYDEHPYRYTMLYALEVPSHGGNTLFANMYAAYDALPADIKNKLTGVDAQHGYYAGRHVTPEILASLGITMVKDAFVHPIITAHEETGRPVLYISRLSTQSLTGYSEDEGNMLLDQLLDHSENPEFVYEHVWAPGDFVIWDNRCLNHARTDFSSGERRLLRRTTVQGIRPAAAQTMHAA